MEKHHIYMGCNITRASRNSAGLRWESFTPKGRVRADTLVGIKQLIKEMLGD